MLVEKSDFIKAVNFSKQIVLNGMDKVNISKNHFRISEESYNQPGVFEYRIMIDGKEYSCGIAISYIKKEIISEWLIRIDENGKETFVFNRDINEDGVSIVNSEINYGTPEENVRIKYILRILVRIFQKLLEKNILGDIALRLNDKQKIFTEIISIYEWFKDLIIIFPNSK